MHPLTRNVALPLTLRLAIALPGPALADLLAPATRLGVAAVPVPSLALPDATATAPLAQVELLSSDAPPPAIPREPRLRHLDVIEALEANGYVLLSVRETLLNRVRIRARNALHLREIVISRASGSILRDVVLETYAASPAEIDQRLRALPGAQSPAGAIDPSLLP